MIVMAPKSQSAGSELEETRDLWILMIVSP